MSEDLPVYLCGRAVTLLLLFSIYQLSLPLYARISFHFALATEVFPERQELLRSLNKSQLALCENYYLGNSSCAREVQKTNFAACEDFCKKAVPIVKKRADLTEEIRGLSTSVEKVSQLIESFSRRPRVSAKSLFELKSCYEIISRSVIHTNRGVEWCCTIALILLVVVTSKILGRVACHQICCTFLAILAIDDSPRLAILGCVLVAVFPQVRLLVALYVRFTEAIEEFMSKFFAPEKLALKVFVVMFAGVSLLTPLWILAECVSIIKTILLFVTTIVVLCEGARQARELISEAEDSVSDTEKDEVIRVNRHDHQLKYFNDGSFSWFCNGGSIDCSRHKGANARWSCRECNYDLCRGCARLFATERKTIVPSGRVLGMFDRLDANQDGVVTVEELRNGLEEGVIRENKKRSAQEGSASSEQGFDKRAKQE